MNRRRVRRWREEEVQKPIVMSDCTKHMGAVDRADHYCAFYSFTRNTLRWWRNFFFFWLLELCVVNSFILCKKVTGLQGLRHLAYGKNFILQLVGTTRNSNAKSEAGQVWQMIMKGSAEYHILSQIPEVDAIKSAWYVLHANNKKQLFTVVKCAPKNLSCIQESALKITSRSRPTNNS